VVRRENSHASPGVKSLLTGQQSPPFRSGQLRVRSGHMEGTCPENPDISFSHKKEGALERTPPDTSHQFDLEVRVLAELLLDIHEFQQKRKVGDSREPRLDGIRPQPKILNKGRRSKSTSPHIHERNQLLPRFLQGASGRHELRVAGTGVRGIGAPQSDRSAQSVCREGRVRQICRPYATLGTHGVLRVLPRSPEWCHESSRMES
jgi:hypothetical protein